jgi:hypothetical protein
MLRTSDGGLFVLKSTILLGKALKGYTARNRDLLGWS